MTPPPDFSILIVTRNTARLTSEAVTSVLTCGDRATVEVVVIDNGSTDGTGEQLKARFPQVRYVYSAENQGFARANNLAASQASGSVLLLLNSDAALQPGNLDAALAYLRATPDCGVLGAQLLNSDGSLQNSVAEAPSLATELLNRSLLKRWRRLTRSGPRLPAHEPVAVDSVIGAFLAIPRATWERFGGLAERYFFYLEETDFCTQVRRGGGRVIHHPGIRVWHHQGASANTVRPAARIEFWRSRYLYFDRHAGPAVNVILRTILPLRLACSWAFNALASPFSPALRERAAWQSTLLRWHARGRPLEGGLRPPNK